MFFVKIFNTCTFINIERVVRKIPAILKISKSEILGNKYFIIVKYKKNEFDGYEDCLVLNHGDVLLTNLKNLIH